VRDGHAVGREQRKENLVDGALAALRLPSRSAPCIMSVLVVHVFESECLHPYAATNFAKVDLRLPSMTKGIGKGPGVSSAKREKGALPAAGGWWLKRRLRRLLALRDKRARNNATFLFLHLAVACALSFKIPSILLNFQRPHCIQLVVHAPTRRVSSPQRTSTVLQLHNCPTCRTALVCIELTI
jgi:hypothetical protein